MLGVHHVAKIDNAVNVCDLHRVKLDHVTLVAELLLDDCVEVVSFPSCC